MMSGAVARPAGPSEAIMLRAAASRSMHKLTPHLSFYLFIRNNKGKQKWWSFLIRRHRNKFDHFWSENLAVF